VSYHYRAPAGGFEQSESTHPRFRINDFVMVLIWKVNSGFFSVGILKALAAFTFSFEFPKVEEIPVKAY